MRPCTRATVVLASFLVACGGANETGGLAPIAPDFVGTAPRLHIDPSLTASDGMNRISPLDVVVFQHDSAILSDAALVQIDRAAAWLARHDNHAIVLEGHTSAAGGALHNEDLATRRLAAVRARLLARGIVAERIVMLNYGEMTAARPGNPNDRRVVLFATLEPIREVVANQLEHTPAMIATWTQDGAELQLARGPGVEPASPSVISRR